MPASSGAIVGRRNPSPAQPEFAHAPALPRFTGPDAATQARPQSWTSRKHWRRSQKRALRRAVRMRAV